MRIITKLGTGCKAKFEQDMALFIVNKFPETLYNSRDQPGPTSRSHPKKYDYKSTVTASSTYSSLQISFDHPP